jgi:hypothetical protein
MTYHRVCNNINTTVATMTWLTVTLVTNLAQPLFRINLEDAQEFSGEAKNLII